MKFKHLHIENIRSYEKLDLDFSDGVTVISGVNGSGKSSILEACFMGIFGADVLRGTTLKIADMMRKDSSKALIALDFEHAGEDYQIEQQFRATKTGANTYKSILRKNGEIIAEQANGTYDSIQKLLNMDEKNFQNCAYIRQGEVDALINARPEERQKMIDDLLRLGKLEEYRERAQTSKTAVNRVLRFENEKKEEVYKNITRLREKNLYDELNRRKEVMNRIDETISAKRQEKDKISNDLTLLDSKLKEIEESKDEIEKLKKEAETLLQKYNAEISKKDEVLQEILNMEKKTGDLSAALKNGRKKVNESLDSCFKSSADSSLSSLKLDENGGLEFVLNRIREEENKIIQEKQQISNQIAVNSINKKTIENEILKKENELKELQKSNDEIKNQIQQQLQNMNEANAVIADGISKASASKDSFLSVLNDLLPDSDSANIISSELPLPLPSDDASWKILVSDIEQLGESVRSKTKEGDAKITEEEKKNALIKGELDEREKNAADIEKELLRIDDEIKEIQSELKNEKAESEKKKKLVSDHVAILEMNVADRNGKIKNLPILKETVPASRYQLNDISAKDIEEAYNLLAKKKETLIFEEAELKSADSEILKSASKKEELLKAGKCPTCGQSVQAETLHAHGAEDESKTRAGIEVRLREISALKSATEFQLSELKEISEIDNKMIEIRAEMNTLSAVEKGKAEITEKLAKDLAEAEQQKTNWNARKVEHTVFCGARKQDLENIEKRLAEFKEQQSLKQEKMRCLFESEKEFSENAGAILLNYKLLKAEEKMNAESQKRMAENENKDSDIVSSLKELQIKLEEETKTEIRFKENESAVLKYFENVSGIRIQIENLAELENEKENVRISWEGRRKLMEQQNKMVEDLKTQSSGTEIKIKTSLEKIKTELENLNLENGNAAEDIGVLAEKRRQSLQTNIQSVSEIITELEDNRSQILLQTGTLQSELSLLRQYETDFEALRNKISFLAYVSEDVSTLEEMYRRIRAEMRSKNIEALDQLLNEMFDFIYSNNAYSHLELDSDYNLKVHEKDGSILEPKQLSGGERAIFNLALRCAIYRLLSLGFGENASGKTSLPPLIFDEPTVFLDSGHVRQLIKLIEHMREDGVGQIIVVSHDDSLIDSADVNFKIEKDPATNASGIV